jgi:type VI secretion system secreted protein VgrG
MQRARVVDAVADPDGRVRVQFEWASQGHECWLPVAEHLQGREPWRVGALVVVSFLEGDADRPLITGCMPTGPMSVPVAQLPAPIEAGEGLEVWLDSQRLLGDERCLQVNDDLKVSFEEDCQLLFRVGGSTVELDRRSLRLAAPRLDLAYERDKSPRG